MPSDASLLRSSLARRMTSLDRVRLTVLRLRGAGEGAAQRSPLGGLIETLKKVVAPGPVTSLNPHQVGPHRRFDTLRMDLEELKEVKERLGGKLNDVVLTTVALGLGRFFRELGERPEDYAGFRALVPASVRGTDSGSARGNQVATLIATLPIAVCDPLEAYACVCDETRFLKTESNAVRGIQLLEDLDDALGLGAVSSAFVLAGKLRSFNTIVTNVPGPPVPVPLFGAPLLEIYGLVPLFAQQALGIALFSYAGQLHWGFNADWEHVGGLHLLVDGMRDAFADLLRAARAHPQA